MARVAATVLWILVSGFASAQETRSLDVLRVDKARHGRITWCLSAVATAFNMLDQPWKWERSPAPETAASRPAARAPEVELPKGSLTAHAQVVPVSGLLKQNLLSAFYSGRDLDAAVDKAVRSCGLEPTDKGTERDVLDPLIEPAGRINEFHRPAIVRSLERVSSDDLAAFVDEAADLFRVHEPLDLRIVVVPSDDLPRFFIGDDSIVISGPPRVGDGVLLRAALAIMLGRLGDAFGPVSYKWGASLPRYSHMLEAAALQLAARGWVTPQGHDALAAASMEWGDTMNQKAAIQLYRFALGIRPVFDDLAIRRITLAEALAASRHVWRGLYAVGYLHGTAPEVDPGWIPATWDVGGYLSRAVPAPLRNYRGIVLRAGDVDLASDGDWSVNGRVLTEGKAPNTVAAHRLAEFIKDRLELLPPELLTRMKLKRIVICSRLAVDGQKRSAVVLPADAGLAYDVDLLSEGDYATHSFYHELFHMVDWLDSHFEGDNQWVALNAPGTSYGNGGTESRNSHSRGPATGFVSWYAQSDVQEDKAETFAGLMFMPGNMSKLMAKDSILAAKAALLKKRLKAFCPQCDAAWWSRVAAAGGR